MSIIDLLRKGDMRTTGSSEKVVDLVSKDNLLFKELFECLESDDPGVRMRSADAIEKVTVKMPGLLRPYKNRIINDISKTNQQEVMWHLAQIFPRLDLTKPERDKLVKLLSSWISTSKSNIVKVFSLQCLADFAFSDPSIRSVAISLISNAMKSAAPSVMSRSKKLLKMLG